MVGWNLNFWEYLLLTFLSLSFPELETWIEKLLSSMRQLFYLEFERIAKSPFLIFDWMDWFAEINLLIVVKRWIMYAGFRFINIAHIIKIVFPSEESVGWIQWEITVESDSLWLKFIHLGLIVIQNLFLILMWQRCVYWFVLIDLDICCIGDSWFDVEKWGFEKSFFNLWLLHLNKLFLFIWSEHFLSSSNLSFINLLKHWWISLEALVLIVFWIIFKIIKVI